METPKSCIRIIGTSHIAKQSAKDIERAYKEFEPDIVAIELDRRRLQSLQEQAAGAEHRIPLSTARQVGITGYLFIIIGRYVQKRLGSIVKVDPGIDMLTAVNLALRDRKQLHLVDQDIMVTTRNLSRKFTFREKMRLLWDIISAPFSKRRLKFDLSRVPDDRTLEMLMGLLRERYPSLYQVLIIDRNIVMARNIDAIVRKYPGAKILLVIGKGHEEDLRQRLNLMQHLADIQ